MTTANTQPYLLPYPVSYGFARKAQPRVMQASFGDGYFQTVVDGINSSPKSWDVILQGTSDLCDQIEDYFDSMNGATPFYFWTPKNEMIRVLAPSWQRSDQNCVNGQVSATFTQVFDGDPQGLIALVANLGGPDFPNILQATENVVNGVMAAIETP